jgi:ribosomal protein L11 methyltransferase
MHNSDKLQPNWLKFSIKADPALVDALSDFLVGVTGAEVEIAVDDDRPTITLNAFLEKQVDDDEQCEDIMCQLSGYVKELADIFQVPIPEIKSSIIEDQDWANTWKEHFKPFTIVPGLVIKPTWENYRAGSEEKVIEMDPGMAFGTGHHATTTLSLELLKSVLHEADGKSVLDVGTGTGILGMAATWFGAQRVLAIDNDPEAVAAALGNVRRNGMEEKMSVSATPLEELQGPFSLVVANIIHDVLIDLAEDLVRLTAKGGKLILSGILTGEQSDNIEKYFADRGLSLTKHLQKKEWSALLFNH